ncbi:MAG: AmmeMemoRadiSam system radical SAM enzyme [Desulfurococcales archaeon]|jgi:pyruvate formate lyase activating enzyme
MNNVKLASLWINHPKDNYVKCLLCSRYCIIAPGKFGVCGVRKNVDGKLYTYVYGLLSAVAVDPIEKKPLMHYKPSSSVLSISTVGCNFFCKFCQNWEISQARLERGLYGEYMSPEEVISLAKKYKADGISFTYNEPTIFFEYMYDVARLAKEEGLFTTMVTNGYMSKEALEEFYPYLDAATVDFKASGNTEFYRKYMSVPDPSPIYNFLKLLREKKVFIEVTNLIVPEIGDKEEDLRRLANWIAGELGEETPFHLLRFYPQYKMSDIPPTSVRVLEKLANIAKDAGLKHVYIGNVWGHPLENTYCPRCGKLVIEREGYLVKKNLLTEEGKCPYCGYKMNVVL